MSHFRTVKELRSPRPNSQSASSPDYAELTVDTTPPPMTTNVMSYNNSSSSPINQHNNTITDASSPIFRTNWRKSNSIRKLRSSSHNLCSSTGSEAISPGQAFLSPRGNFRVQDTRKCTRITVAGAAASRLASSSLSSSCQKKDASRGRKETRSSNHNRSPTARFGSSLESLDSDNDDETDTYSDISSSTAGTGTSSSSSSNSFYGGERSSGGSHSHHHNNDCGGALYDRDLCLIGPSISRPHFYQFRTDLGTDRFGNTINEEKRASLGSEAQQKKIVADHRAENLIAWVDSQAKPSLVKLWTKPQQALSLCYLVVEAHRYQVKQKLSWLRNKMKKKDDSRTSLRGLHPAPPPSTTNGSGSGSDGGGSSTAGFSNNGRRPPTPAAGSPTARAPHPRASPSSAAGRQLDFSQSSTTACLLSDIIVLVAHAEEGISRYEKVRQQLVALAFWGEEDDEEE